MKPILKILSASLLLLVSVPSLAQNNDAYLEFVKQRNKEYSDWRKKANAEFADYLEKAWKAFKIQAAVEDPLGPVPDEQPVFDENVKTSKIPSSHGIPSFDQMCLPANSPALTLSAEYYPDENSVNVNFFGVSTPIPFDKGLILSRVDADEKKVADAWRNMNNAAFLPTVDALTQLSTQNNLNDWAVYMLIKTLTEAVYTGEFVNERIATQAFLLLQMRYKARVSKSGKELFLLLPIKEQVYQVNYVEDKDNKMTFFIFGYNRLTVDLDLFTTADDFPEAKSLLSLTIPKPMKIGGVTEYKKIKQPLWSSILGEDFSVPVNQPYISLALNYPQSDLITYHHSAVDTETAKAVLRAVKYKIIKNGLDQQQAAAYILNLLQNGFEYKTDYELFGRSKPLFIEESFFYGANNCKDRVLIFSWLVKNLLNLNTIMLGYPNHVACGVEFTTPVDGDSFTYKNHKYVMCDPTCKNAPVGATMPKFRGMDPMFMEL